MTNRATDTAYRSAADKRIAHVRQHLDFGFTPQRLGVAEGNVTNGAGNPKGSAMNLASHAQAMAVSSWFERRDLASMRQWFYVTGRLEKLVLEIETDKFGPGGHTLQLISPLLSNHRSLIEWFANYDEPYDLECVEDHKSHDFWAYQTIVALRGDWPRLRERCERVIADPPSAAGEKKYQNDHAFFLALALQDRAAMEAALAALVGPKAVRDRNNDDSGYTADLISTAAVIYAKLAWLHGHEVRVDSPYVPAEWLPVEPLQHYDPKYRFLA